MGIERLYADSIEAAYDRGLRNPAPPVAPDFGAWSLLSSGFAGFRTGLLEQGASALEGIAAFGRYSEQRRQEMGARTADPERKAAAQAGMESLALDARRTAQASAPDPETAHQAEQIIHGLTRFSAKAVGSVVAAGPIGGAAILAGEETNTAYRDLRAKGIDSETALKVAAVQGVISAAGVVLPVSGAALPLSTAGKVGATAGLVAIGGPGSYVAQESLSRDILQRAGYADEAAKHDPTDWLGLVISTVLPGAFGAFALRGALKAKPIGPIKTEAGVRDAVQLTPAEQAASDAFERSAANLAELRAEIARTKDPAARQVLEAELAKQTQAAARAGQEAVAEAGARSPAVVDAARVAVLQETLVKSLPDEPQAMPRLMARIDDLAEGRAPVDDGPLPGFDTPAAPRTLADMPAPAEVADGLRAMAGSAYWAQRGGSIIRDPNTAIDPTSASAHLEGDVVGRTKWLPAEEWFGRMRSQLGAEGLSKQADIAAAVEAAIEGRPLGARQQRTVDWMRQELDDIQAQMRAAEFAPVDADMLAQDAFGLGLSSRDAPDLALVTRAAQKDPDAVERAAIMHEDDDAAFMGAIKEILGEEQPAAGAEVAGPSLGGSGAAAREAQGRPGADAARAADAGRPAAAPEAARVDADIVQRLAQDAPETMVTLPGADDPMRLDDALAEIQRQRAQDEMDAELVRAAVLCDLSP